MENKGNLTILKLITASILGLILKSWNKVEVEFPTEISGYKFQRVLKRREIRSKMFVFALYKNKKGQKALAKMWRGRIKDFVYHTLLNEIAVYKTLNNLLARLSGSMPEKFKDIQIPKYIRAVETENSLLILTEYIEGVSTAQSQDINAFEIYKKCADFLRFLGSQMTRREKQAISKRTTLSIVSLYLLFLIRAITVRPHLLGDLIKGLPLVMNSLPGFFNKREISLGHRDLNLKNVLVSKNKLYIVDLQFCIFSYELYDLFMVLRSRFSDKNFRSETFREVTRRLSQGENKNWVKGLMVICATHSLSGNNLSKRTEKNSIKFLNFAIEERGKHYGLTALNNLRISNKL